ncbi:alkaline phosphatase family protein [Paraburkholderia kirstenboschensis]|uniref:Alkaline phosphatase family protein n=1 Tax=Paraburkholderia kirstenboschensis TaxID=1245436 RepID=A0ABZ0EE37_9BURK|nr:alkaline phosphatase family protein [Paraburkholderia kirstenboschensis]WOD15499.1 alkaline phosphatase family protein [Paraburkholderia kirstenboschensis]
MRKAAYCAHANTTLTHTNHEITSSGRYSCRAGRTAVLFRPAVERAGQKTHNFAFDRLGVRVPAIVVSPFVPAGTIDHSVYDHSSILKTTDTLFGLNGALNLTARVRAADSFSEDVESFYASLRYPAMPVARRCER